MDSINLKEIKPGQNDINCNTEILQAFIENGHLAEKFLIRKMNEYEIMLDLTNKNDRTRISNTLNKIKAWLNVIQRINVYHSSIKDFE
jgi:hypothetical protein